MTNLVNIFGKSDIYSFQILINDEQGYKNLDFLCVKHFETGKILCQITNIIRDSKKLIAKCSVIGYRDDGILKNIRTPFSNEIEIEVAEDKFIENVIGFKSSSKNFIGMIEDHPNIRVNLDLKKLITKHLAILAKSGAGKSYTVGVILEEIIKKNIPILILDPHGEYPSLKYENDNEKDINRLHKFGLEKRGFGSKIVEYSTENIEGMKKISLDIDKLTNKDFIDILPQKLSPAQQALIYNILSNSSSINFDELIFNLSNEESNAKWGLISLIEQMKKLKLFSKDPTDLNQLIKPGKVSIINLKGVDSQVGEILVAQLLKNLFFDRKKELIPPFLLVLEEAHNFCPEKNLGELKSSKIIRTIAGEGRKFGLGLTIISQRPAKIDKNVLSQCSTQIILKITNPNDLKAVIQSSEGISAGSENEIQKLNIGTCMLCGIVDLPLKINIRPRLTKHGGESVNLVLDYENIDEFKETESEKIKNKEKEVKSQKEKLENNKKEFIEYVEDIQINKDKKISLIPALFLKITLKNKKEITILVDKLNFDLIKKLNSELKFTFPKVIRDLENNEEDLLKNLVDLKDNFNPNELLIKTSLSLNEINKVSQSLEKKGIIKKAGNFYNLQFGLFLKKLDQLDCSHKIKYDELNFHSKLDEKLKTKDIISLFEKYFKVENYKEVFILKNI